MIKCHLEIAGLNVFNFCSNSLKEWLILYFSDDIIGYRNQNNGVLDRIGKIRPRNEDLDGVSPGKPAISFKIDVNESCCSTSIFSREYLFQKD